MFAYINRWLGHVARMERDRLPKRVMEGSVEGRRPVGRPKMRWYNNAMGYCVFIKTTFNLNIII